jgi:ribosome-associated heat shock protein Hsp15
MIARMAEAPEEVRLDRWLWAARLLKTRPLAAEAVRGGHVEVNGRRMPPGRRVRVGDRVEVVLGDVRREVVIRGVSERRGPASVAALLYEETPESIEARSRAADERRVARDTPRGGPRPTKRDRRRLDTAAGRRPRS